MRRGGGGGLYGNFVSASSNVDNKAYRGAEIPTPECLNAGAGRGGRGPGPGSGPVIGGFGEGVADKGGKCHAPSTALPSHMWEGSTGGVQRVTQ